MPGALADYRILDLSRFLAGPYGAMLLADMGAQVIKVEPPEGDFARQVPPYFHRGESAYFMSVNRNKKGIALDLRREEGRQVFYDLVKVSDAVWDNFRPGVLERLRIDYDTLKEMNPRIICCSVTGYGPEGPLRDKPGFDTIVQARSGGMSLTGEPGRYYRMGIPIADLAGGMFAALGLLGALVAREKTGVGQRVDVALLSGQVSLLTYQATYYLMSGRVPEPVGTGHTSIVPIRAFRTQDHFVVIECSNQKFWGNLCQAIGMPELEKDERFADGEKRYHHRGELYQILEEVFARKTTEEWLAILGRHEVPSGPINTIDRALSEPQIAVQNMVVAVDHTLGGQVRLAGNPIKMSATPGETFRSPPTLGEHTEEILSQLLGYSPERIEALRDKKVVL